MNKLNSRRNGLPVINDRAAGIDIGSRFHVVAVPADLDDQPVRTFEAFTADLECMARWLAGTGRMRARVCASIKRRGSS